MTWKQKMAFLSFFLCVDIEIYWASFEAHRIQMSTGKIVWVNSTAGLDQTAFTKASIGIMVR